jgi:phage terminase large subunit-like protein
VIAATDYNLLEEIRLIPGYDPYAQAGDCVFDEDAGRLAIDFIEMCCTHIKGELAGQPFIMEPWERGITGNLFGWMRPDGLRRYRECFVFVPRKNGKTTWVASLLNYVLFCDGEPGAEIYCAAADREQANLVYSQAAGMARAEENMARLSRHYATNKTTFFEKTNSFYRAISAEAATKHGYNAHFVVVDELHAQPTRELVDVLITSTGARRQPLVLHITTSDYEREGSICNEKHDYAGKVRDGLIEDPSFLPVIYEATTEDDWKDPQIWAKANPNLGVSVSEEYIERECKRAQESPAFENTFKRLHLNIRTESFARWITSEAWAACGDPGQRIEDFKGRKCWAGLDLASTSDFTAFVLVFEEAGAYFAFPYFWVPRRAAAERERKARITYSTWARAGHLCYTEGGGGVTTDYDVVRRDINTIVRDHKLNLREIAADRLFQGVDICKRLAEDDGFEVIEHGQGYCDMALPTKETERIILAGALGHPDNPVLNWMIANTVVQEDAAANRKPDKKNSSEKIDGTVALIMGVGRATANAGPPVSVYSKRGLRTL